MKNLLYLFAFLVTLSTFAQGEANVWYFGRNAGIDFNTPSPTAVTTGALNTLEGCSSFSDGAGNLLFYSDGITVYDNTHAIMNYSNGLPANNLKGNPSSTQSGMIIPKPESPNIYYLFTVGNNQNPAFDLYTIDMSLNGGLGELIDENGNGAFSEDLALPTGNQANWSEKVTAVKGADCNTYWIVSFAGNTNNPIPSKATFYAYKIDNTGVNTAPVISEVDDVGIPNLGDGPNTRGYLKISPDGTTIAVAHQNIFKQCLIYSFNNDTGDVINDGNSIFNNNQDGQAYGVEFSSSSKKLYLSSASGFRENLSQPATNYKLFQFDLEAANIEASKALIHQQIGYRGALQLGPDGKIYATIPLAYDDTNGDAQFLDVIENPNEDAADIIFTQNALSLNGRKATQGLPPFIASIFSQIELTADDGMGNTTVINDQVFNMCTGDNIDTSPEILTGSITYKWYLDSDPIPFSTSPNLSFTNVTPADNGVYKLVAEQTDICGNSNTLEGEFTITVSDYSIANPAQNIVECDDNNDGTFLFELTAKDAEIIGTQTGMEVVYFDSQANADNNTSPLPTSYDSGNATIYARIHPIGNNNCYDTTTFDIELFDSAFPTDIATMTPLELCDDTSIGTLDDGLRNNIDLTVKDAEILNTQSATDFTLTYFTDAGFLNPITTPANAFDNTGFAGGLTIYVQMTNNLNADCFATTSFDLIIYEQPVANTAPTIPLCDDDNLGTMPFVLTDQDSFINTVAGMTITYHPTLADAETSSTSNAISSPFESGNATIYARVENDLNTSCYDTSFFDIEVYDSAFPLDATNISPIESCDNTSFGTDTDGIILFDLTQNETDILNGQSSAEFTLTYFTDTGYSIPISTPSNSFQNTVTGGQTIYVRMTNNLSGACFSDTSFEIEVFELPTILDTYLFKNCDEDGDPNAETDFNLDEANYFITLGDTSLTVTYYTTFANADSDTSPISSLYNNSNGNIVYARVENTDSSCHRVSTITLQVSTTSFPTGFSVVLDSCDDDDTIDGLHLFDLSDASPTLIAEFPSGQNLTVHYYRTLEDAQQEKDEILPQDGYMSETPFSQTVYVRVESDDNGECFGLGGNLTLVVNPRPEFDVDPYPEGIVCLNLPPITLQTLNPNGVYTYEWTDENDAVISNLPSAQVSEGGTYTVIATSTDGNNCESFPHTIIINESIIADIDYDDVTITDDSDNNTITINNDANNLGIGDYEFALNDGNGGIGFYQDEPFFNNVAPGIHTIYVQDKNNCGVATLEIAVIGFPKFLTPNNDGENDTWQVKGVSDGFFTNSTIYIFDRYGKIIANVDATGEGWDGYYNGEALPSDDYWFTAELIDSSGNIRNRKGHFSLIRR